MSTETTSGIIFPFVLSCECATEESPAVAELARSSINHFPDTNSFINVPFCFVPSDAAKRKDWVEAVLLLELYMQGYIGGKVDLLGKDHLHFIKAM